MYLFYALVSTLFVIDVGKCNSDMIRATLANVPEEGLMNFTQLAESYGFEAVEHDVITEDGYILKLFQIPGDKKKPILYCHGIFDSADGWLLRGNTSVVAMAARQGYGTWAINFRGNRYSREHVTLNPDKDAEYWDFSMHEFATIDLKACIDYVLDFTGQRRLSIIGFSEGTTATFILGSSLPAYNDKVNMFIAMAPVAYLSHARSALASIITWSPFLNFIIPSSIVEVAGYYSLSKAIMNLLCTQLAIGYELCYKGAMSMLSGEDDYGIDKEFFPTIIAHFPAGTSRKNLLHFAQIGLEKRFAQFNYGPSKNLYKYHSFSAPVYDLTKFTMRTVLVSGNNDPVSTLQDIELAMGELPNVIEHKVVERDSYTHLDHLWARDAHVVEYPYILDMLAKNHDSVPEADQNEPKLDLSPASP